MACFSLSNRCTICCPRVPIRPQARTSDLAEQCWLNGERVKPRHVFFRRDTLDIEVVGLRDHNRRIARSESAVQ